VLYRGPLLLLTDGLSASASEVLAAGLRANCRAALVGERTFGKGKIQAVFGLTNGEGLTLTVAQYLTPSGVAIQSYGIQPDIPLPVANPYLGMMLSTVSPSITKPDLNSIPFQAAEELLKGKCNAPTSLSTASSFNP
jgi:C-terminal processing protease CtpA/Prc